MSSSTQRWASGFFFPPRKQVANRYIRYIRYKAGFTDGAVVARIRKRYA